MDNIEKYDKISQIVAKKVHGYDKGKLLTYS